ncbi:hypothetical protein L1987_79135 [Smallanthus sonchifolius]|uniref:Uncharacterized protein n=1 Tax=Smallanthus sonchifolius TaxID=185202 RepID=A0ACB8ZEH3_9ASTR|nr:hypothetical protein L1987_79135 [Smallanthus sonchifolius]
MILEEILGFKDGSNNLILSTRVNLHTNPNQPNPIWGQKVRQSTRSTPSRGSSIFQQIFNTTQRNLASPSISLHTSGENRED